MSAPVRLPAPGPDGRIAVSPYLLDRWERRGRVELVWIDRATNTTGYVINGRRYRYEGERLAPRVTDRRRTFTVAELTPLTD